MKQFLALVFCSSAVFAQNADVFLGHYSIVKDSSSQEGDAVVNKRHGQYELVLSWSGDKGKDNGLYEMELPLSIDKYGKLSGETDKECDDPGCCWFDQISVSSVRKYGGQPMLEMSYSGACYKEDSGEEGESFEGTLYYLKN